MSLVSGKGSTLASNQGFELLGSFLSSTSCVILTSRSLSFLTSHMRWAQEAGRS